MDRNDFEYNIKNKLQDYQEDASSVSWRRMFLRLHRSKLYLGLILLAVLLLAGILLLNDHEPGMSAETQAVLSASEEIDEVSNAKNADLKGDLKTEISSSSMITGEKTTEKKHLGEKDTPVEHKHYNTDSKPTTDQNAKHNAPEQNNRQEISPQPTGSYGMGAGLIALLEKYSIKLEPNRRNSIQNRPQDIYREDYYSPPESRSRRFELSLEAGPSVSWSGISDNPDYKNLIMNRKNNEQPLLYATFGLKLSYRPAGRLILGSGLDYSVFGEKQDYNLSWDVYDPDASYFRQDTIWGYIYDPPIYGEPVILGYDSSWVEVYREINEKRQNINRYSYFELPLLVGYRFETNGFILQPNAGVSVGFLNKSAGYIHTGLPAAFEKLETGSGFVKQTIWSAVFEFDLAWKLNERQRIFVKPFYKTTWNSIMENYPLDVRYHQAGLKFGYTICF